jgi:DNA modification methylase
MSGLYYKDDYVEIWHGDCREILPTLPIADLVLTDPPYGIRRSNGMGGGGFDGFGNAIKRSPRSYLDKWDSERPDAITFAAVLRSARRAVIWGGNYYADLLPVSTKWLVWDKQQTMPSYSDCELAWTSLNGVSTKMFRYNGSGLLAIEQDRWHPTQKPVALMKWCLTLSPDAEITIDPFCGSGSTLRAAKDLGRKALGVDVHEAYCEIAAKRCNEAQPSMYRLLEVRESQGALING